MIDRLEVELSAAKHPQERFIVTIGQSATPNSAHSLPVTRQGSVPLNWDA